MSAYTWDDDALRRYVLRSNEIFWMSPEQADERRSECMRELSRIVPALQLRLLESTGSMTSERGIAMLATEAVERSRDPRRFWLVASTTPWEYLEEWIGDDLESVYKRAAKKRKEEKKTLAGIEAASSRPELE